ncbi:hypothetical protein Pnap_0428 [Polaromonas naphthalenivorans CJ2]|uniref:Transposase IS4-like domain-containing protein n=1 Tax=Polaromonas naphthalenivorans (strain CJ2) TaxID=365044 RepID=A1VJC2_POLNA|nr:hypothetical protein Pnap_0428 [Polaromonas naphthalenivorans CJ2]
MPSGPAGKQACTNRPHIRLQPPLNLYSANACFLGGVHISADYFTNHPADTPRITLVRAIKARWACEQAHQQLKDELGLDHYEGRSWLGLHHHALLSMIAFGYLQHRRLASALQAGKKTGIQCTGSPATAVIAGGTPRHHRHASSRDLRSVPSLQRHDRPASA